jgi:hypothetical protein
MTIFDENAKSFGFPALKEDRFRFQKHEEDSIVFIFSKDEIDIGSKWKQNAGYHAIRQNTPITIESSSSDMVFTLTIPTSDGKSTYTIRVHQIIGCNQEGVDWILANVKGIERHRPQPYKR